MQSYSRQQRHQLGLDLLEGRIYERSFGFYPNQKVQYNRSIENCVQRPRLVYVRAVRFTSAHLTQISRGSLNAFGPFRKLKNKTRTFPETKSSGGNNQQGPLASTPQQIAELFNSYFGSVFTAPSEVRTLSAPFTPSHPT